jgi:hypothetical protein
MISSSTAAPGKPKHVFDRDRERDGLMRFAASADPDVRLGIVSGGPYPARHQIAGDRAQHQRITGGGAVARGGEPGIGLVAKRPPEQDCHRVFPQRSQLQQVRAGAGDDRAERPGGVIRPGGQDQQDGQALDAVLQIAQPAQGRLVRPVGIIQREQERSDACQVGGQPVQPVEPGELPPARRLAGKPRHGHRERGGTLEQAGTRFRLSAGLDSRLEEPPDNTEGELPLQLVAAGGVDGHPGLPRPEAELGQQGALAGAGAALDDEHVTLALHRGGDQLIDPGQVAPASGWIWPRTRKSAGAKLFLTLS